MVFFKLGCVCGFVEERKHIENKCEALCITPT